MPNRYLREAFLESERVSSLSWQAEVTWLRLIVTVDDWGRCESNPRLLRTKLFPLRLERVRETDLSRWLAQCETAGLLRLYTINEKSYLQMMKWEKGRAAKSKCPEHPDIVSGCLQPYTNVDDGPQMLVPPTPTPTPIPTPTPAPTPTGASAASREGNRSLPPSLDTPAFRETWERWVIHWSAHFAGGKPMPNGTADMHLAACIKLGATGAIEAIDNAIGKGLRQPAVPFDFASGSTSGRGTSHGPSAPLPPAIPEPPGWQLFVEREYPDCPYGSGQPKHGAAWSAVAIDHQKWITEKMLLAHAVGH